MYIFSAHTTHFTEAGWTYFSHESKAVGFLKHNGSYVTLTNKERNQLTIVIENIVSLRIVCHYFT